MHEFCARELSPNVSKYAVRNSRYPISTMNYDDWNCALTQNFFNPQEAQKPVYLHVDEELLQEIAAQHRLPPEAARDSFVQSVRERAYCVQQNRSDPFFKIKPGNSWENKLRQNPATPPPSIAFLGLCVLAAVDMTGDDTLNISSGNYYVRLNRLLGLSGRDQPNGFDAIEQVWERLHQWLADDLQGEFGLPTASNTLYGRHIGYPISQALMRRTDQEELPHFFQWCGLEPGEANVDATYFKQQLQIWASRTTCSFSKQLKRVFTSNRQEHIAALADMSLAAYKAWDGSATTIKGERRAEIDLQLNRVGRGFELTLYPKAPADFPDGVYGRTHLQRADDANWFEPLGNEDLERWLRGHSLDLRHDKYRLTLSARHVVPLRSDSTSYLGGWVACNRISLGERHLILCHQTQQQAVAAYLAQFGEGSERVLRSRDPIYADWVCFENVRISRYAAGNWEELDCLVPIRQTGIRLSGGLKLKQGVWLQGGEPEIIVTAEAEAPIYLDGRHIETAVSGSKRFDLRHYNLPEGTHTIRIGTQERTIAIAYPGNNLLGQHRLQVWGYPFYRAGDTQYRPLSLTAEPVPRPESIPSGHLYVAGTHILHSAGDTPPPRQHLLILPYGAQRYIILGRHIGDLFEPRLPTYLPQWQAEDYLQGYKQVVPFAPQWLITISHRGNPVLRAVGQPQTAVPQISSPELAGAWRHWAGKRNLSRRMAQRSQAQWRQYNQVARDDKHEQ